MSLTVVVESHPFLEVGAFVCRLVDDLASASTPSGILAFAEPGALAPLASSDAVRTAVRDLLRHGGFKPAVP
jgi:hypothetical protein